MGFLQAINDLGMLEKKEGIESYLKFPLNKGGKIIRVFLNIKEINKEKLNVLGINKIDLIDQINEPEMKLKILYRDKIGANVNWAFTPIHKLGKPKNKIEENRKEWIGEGGWSKNKKSHFYKIMNRVLKNYEEEEIINAGATELIMGQMEERIEDILEKHQGNDSFVLLFGGENAGQFVYPGEILAFVKYFKKKLMESLNKSAESQSKLCFLCNNLTEKYSSISSIFKFSTTDKINFLPGLDEKMKKDLFTVCSECYENISAGRNRIESNLVITDILPKMRIWVIPEVVSEKCESLDKKVVDKLESIFDDTKQITLSEKQEEGLLRKLTRQEKGLVFHFLFWEKNNAQELIHLMVEDVPPERLAFLEKTWQKVIKAIFGRNVARGLSLDWALKNLYYTLSNFSGKSNEDKLVIKDLSLRILGKMLLSSPLPIDTFKKFIVSRTARLIYETESWDEAKKNLLYGQIWIDYMTLLNRR